jgi:hypothetical protein
LNSSSNPLQLPCQFPAILALDQLIPNRLVIGQTRQAGLLHGRDMEKDVRAAVVGGDEAKALCGVEPFHFSGLHGVILGFAILGRTPCLGNLNNRKKKENDCARKYAKV